MPYCSAKAGIATSSQSSGARSSAELDENGVSDDSRRLHYVRGQSADDSARSRLIEKAQPLFVDGDRFSASGGLDFWFAPGAGHKVPVRWKQFLVTWSAIYPLVLGVPLIVVPLLRQLAKTLNSSPWRGSRVHLHR